MAVAFDTLSAAKALEAAGVAPDQAEEHARQMQALRADLATKADLKAAQDTAESGRDHLATKADLETAKADLEAGLAAQEIRMMDRMARWFVWHFAGMVGLAGLAVAAIKYLP